MQVLWEQEKPPVLAGSPTLPFPGLPLTLSLLHSVGVFPFCFHTYCSTFFFLPARTCNNRTFFFLNNFGVSLSLHPVCPRSDQTWSQSPTRHMDLYITKCTFLMLLTYPYLLCGFVKFWSICLAGPGFPNLQSVIHYNIHPSQYRGHHRDIPDPFMGPRVSVLPTTLINGWHHFKWMSVGFCVFTYPLRVTLSFLYAANTIHRYTPHY